MLTNIKNLLLKPNKVLQSIYIIVFRVLLDYMYYNIVSPLYSYIGMTAEQSTFYYMVSWIMVICYILMMFTIIDVEKNGAVVLSIILIISLIGIFAVADCLFSLIITIGNRLNLLCRFRYSFLSSPFAWSNSFCIAKTIAFPIPLLCVNPAISPYFYPCEKESDSIETFFHCWFLSAYYCPPLSWKNFYSTNLSIFSIFLFKSQKKKALCGLSYQLWILKFFKHIKTSCCLYCVNFRAVSLNTDFLREYLKPLARF